MQANEHYEVLDDDIQKLLKKLGHRLGADMPEGWGFTLLIFETNKDDGSVFYISSASRDSMRTALVTFLNKTKDI